VALSLKRIIEESEGNLPKCVGTAADIVLCVNVLTSAFRVIYWI